MSKDKDGHIYCWLCNRKIGNYPDSFNAIYVNGSTDEDFPRAICVDPCLPKANILIKHEFTHAKAIG